MSERAGTAASSAERRLRRALEREGTERERRLARAWRGPGDPTRILVIRLHAIGDALVTLPVAAGLRQRYPGARLGMVVGDRAAPVGQCCRWFDEVHVLAMPASRFARIRSAVRLGLRLRDGWDVVLDLQRNEESRILRRLAAPRAFGEMDRFSARHCLERTLAAVNDAGISIEPRLEPHLRPELVAEARARITAGAPGADRLVLLNPGGAFPTRQWPTARWVELARRFPHRAAFVITGLERVADVARMLRAADDIAVVDLVGRSSLAEGLAAVAACDLAITEDGAFMHAAWTGGVPTVALLGGTRSDWVRPLGPRARYRGSDDLPCGNCMLAVCARGDVHCLDRVGVDEVIAMAISVMNGAT